MLARESKLEVDLTRKKPQLHKVARDKFSLEFACGLALTPRAIEIRTPNALVSRSIRAKQKPQQ